jgi:hypothetical protein
LTAKILPDPQFFHSPTNMQKIKGLLVHDFREVLLSHQIDERKWVNGSGRGERGIGARISLPLIGAFFPAKRDTVRSRR